MALGPEATEAALRRALERRELVLHYQPQVEVSSNRVVGVEALVRWQHPEWGLIPPGRFIGLAEELGVIHEIDAWVLKKACDWCLAWNGNGQKPVRVAVNISGRDVVLSSLYETVADVLDLTGVNPALLELEITESFVMHEPEQAISKIVDGRDGERVIDWEETRIGIRRIDEAIAVVVDVVGAFIRGERVLPTAACRTPWPMPQAR